MPFKKPSTALPCQYQPKWNGRGTVWKHSLFHVNCHFHGFWWCLKRIFSFKQSNEDVELSQLINISSVLTECHTHTHKSELYNDCKDTHASLWWRIDNQREVKLSNHFPFQMDGWTFRKPIPTVFFLQRHSYFVTLREPNRTNRHSKKIASLFVMIRWRYKFNISWVWYILYCKRFTLCCRIIMPPAGYKCCKEFTMRWFLLIRWEDFVFACMGVSSAVDNTASIYHINILNAMLKLWKTISIGCSGECEEKAAPKHVLLFWHSSDCTYILVDIIFHGVPLISNISWHLHIVR